MRLLWGHPCAAIRTTFISGLIRITLEKFHWHIFVSGTGGVGLSHKYSGQGKLLLKHGYTLKRLKYRSTYFVNANAVKHKVAFEMVSAAKMTVVLDICSSSTLET